MFSSVSGGQDVLVLPSGEESVWAVVLCGCWSDIRERLMMLALYDVRNGEGVVGANGLLKYCGCGGG